MSELAALKELLQVAALIIGSVLAIFAAGRWFGWSHKKLIEQIGSVKGYIKRIDVKLTDHIDNEDRIFDRLEAKVDRQGEVIKELVIACNGNLKKLLEKDR